MQFATLSSHSLSLPSIRVEPADFLHPDAFSESMKKKFPASNNSFFKNANFIIDYSKIVSDPETKDVLTSEIISKHSQIVRDCGIQPVGAINVTPSLQNNHNGDIPILSVQKTGEGHVPINKQPSSSTTDTTNKPPIVIPNSIRSGASVQPEKGRSLIILGDVKLGADVESARSIHIIGSLEGKVSAGCFGDENSIISCAGKFKPSFVAVAGHALVGDTILDESELPRLVYLEEGTKKIIVQ